MKLPFAFENRMREYLGEEAEAFFASYEEKSLHGLRFNKKRELPREVTQGYSEPVPWEETGFYYDGEQSPGKSPLHSGGAYYIQEPSAMAPAACLDIGPGMRVLDLCAAPGGKSSQIAGSLSEDSLLVCNEIVPKRARILSENIERMGIKNALVISEDPENIKERFEGFFDRILVDAPCSGEGMFRKNPEAMKEWSEETPQMCADRSKSILEAAWRMLSPGGRLVYSTCTFAAEENENNIISFLREHPEAGPGEIPELLRSLGGPLICNEGDMKEPEKFMCRLYPHRVRGEGHFLAVLQKSGNSVPGLSRGAGKRNGAKIDKAREALLVEFLDKYIKDKDNPLPLGGGDSLMSYVNQRDKWLLFGQNLYVMPPFMPDIDRLKVLRPGLCLGSFEKNRFEPSHSLAMAMRPEEAAWYRELSEGEAIDYLKGMSLSCDPSYKGWVLTGFMGCPLGWGKAAGGILKNHYPKGLRIMC